MIQLEDVTKIYHEGKDNQVVALEGITLGLAAEETVVFKGASGSGKTTLLSLIGCLSKPSSGRIKLNGELISNLPETFLTDVRRNSFGFVFQRFNLLRGLDVLENIMLPAYPTGPNLRVLRNKAMELLERLSMEHRAASRTEFLSGGEAQRVAIARALINDPMVIIADEPTANLDSRLAEQFLSIMKDLRNRGTTVILSSHDARIWQADLVDRVVAMQDGHLVKDVALRTTA